MNFSKNEHIDYWSDIEIEKKKPFWIENVDDQKMLDFLRKTTNLEKGFADSLIFAAKLGRLKGRVLDIGAGVGWTSALLSKEPSITEIEAVDVSEHRLNEIAPIVFKQLEGDWNKFSPIIGEFASMDFAENSYDVAVFCQSLYMFDRIDQILKRIYSLLKDDGILIIACERITPEYPFAGISYIRQKLQWLIRGRTDSSGNHRYQDKDYRSAVRNAGFEYKFQNLNYPVFPRSIPINAGNYFGLK